MQQQQQQPPPPPSNSMILTRQSSRSVTRRRWWAAVCTNTFGTGMLVLGCHPQVAWCSSSSTSSVKVNPLPNLLQAQETLDILLQNWNRATIDCTYADVPRELLESKNKELLLEKASTFALFDKSVSVESCKTTNRIVRDYLGVTGKGPLANGSIEKQMKLGLEYVDGDDLEDYVTALESFSQAYSKASSLSYAAGIADFDAVNNFSKQDADATELKNKNSETKSNLEQTKEAIRQAKQYLDIMIQLLQKTQPSTTTTTTQ